MQQQQQQQRSSYTMKKFYIDKVIEPTIVKLQKLTLYISLSDEDLPTIPPRKQYHQQFVTQLRMYFNDKELLIYKDSQSKQSYLQQKQFQQRILSILTKLVDKKKTYQQISFVDVIQLWIQQDTLVQIVYGVYDEIVKNNVIDYLTNLQRMVSSTVAKQNKSISNNKNNQSIIQKQKHHQSSSILNAINNSNNHHKQFTIQTQQRSSSTVTNAKLSNKLKQLILPSPKNSQFILPPITPSQQPLDTFTYYLQKFYLHYAKKSPNTSKTQQFQKLQHFYTTINLNKFMLYCKEVGLLKLDKKITINYVKKLFVNNQDQRTVIEYEVFAKLVTQILFKVYKTQQQVREKGYQMIGVKNRKNFVQTMGKVGVLVPLKKIVFAKVQDNNNSRDKKQKKVDLQLLDRLKSIEKQQKHRQQSINNNSKQIKRLHKQNSSLSKLQRQSIINNITNNNINTTNTNNSINGGYSNYSQPLKNQQLTKSSSLGTLPTIYSNHNNQHKQKVIKQDKNLKQLLQIDLQDDNEDPYLRRFKDQQKRYQQQQQRQRQKYIKKQLINVQKDNNNKTNQGNNNNNNVIQRIDKRMENVVRKVR